MDDKKEEKILKEIREKVISHDQQAQKDVLQRDTAEATLEALSDMTSLSRSEIESIADSVRTSYVEDEEKSVLGRLKRMIQKVLPEKGHAVKVEPFKNKAFLAHFTIFCMVNGMLAIINFLYSPSAPWFFYPALAWGTGLALHYLHGCYFPQINKFYKQSKDKEARRRQISIKRQAFIAHLTVYSMINAMLALTNIIYSPSVLWVIYPMAGWGIGLMMHYIFSRD